MVMLDDAHMARGDRQVLKGDEVHIRNIIDPLPSYVLMVDSDHRIVMANEALYKTFGLRTEDVLGAYCPKLVHGVDGPYAGCPVEEACATGKSVEREMYDPSQDSWTMSAAYVTNLVTTENKSIFLHVVSDITEKKKADEELTRMHAGLEETVALRTRELESANQELQNEIQERARAEALIRKLAFFDGLTGLPNRANFNRLLTEAIHSAQRHERKFAVALLDLDGLKGVNDTMGHDAGDELLHAVGGRLEEMLRGDDTAARMGGDEFMFIFKEIGDASDISPIGERLLTAFREPYSINGMELRVTASVGGAVYPDDAEDEVTLVKKADLAMYEAKNSGGDRFCASCSASEVST
jgi:diguanylate cyclase (GGDEF)-like protein/PAS domain S-box-containing protein